MAIKRFKHNGLKRFFVRGETGRIAPALAEKLEERLHNLDQAESPEDIALPGYYLHQLTGDRRGNGRCGFPETGVPSSGSRTVTP